MSYSNGQNRALHFEKPLTHRQMRAQQMWARALSPVRIVKLLLCIPILTAVLATSIYIRTSPYEPAVALAHLIARGGCGAASYVGLAPAYYGEIGYHARNDADENGVACEIDSQFVTAPAVDSASLVTAPNSQERMASGAKFLKP